MKKITLCLMLILAIIIVPGAIFAEENVTEVADKAALVKAVETSGTVKLTADIDLDSRLLIDTGVDVTLDLNGKTLGVPDVGYNYGVTVKGNLTITGNGTVNIKGLYGIGTSTAGGNVTVKNGTFNGTESDYMFGAFGGKIVIEDGTFNGNYCVANAFDGYTTTIEIKGGTYNNAETTLVLGNTKVSGGTFNQEIEKQYLASNFALEYKDGKYVAAERTIKVEGLENAVDAKETEKILLESFEKWDEENSEIAKEIANTNITISLSFNEVPDEKVNQIPLEDWEAYVDTLSKKDVNAKMTKKFIQVYVYISNDYGGTYLTKLVKPIALKMNAPELDDVADGYERKYYAVREYIANINSKEGKEELKYDVLDAKLSKDGKTIEITMPDGTLSICTVAYSDVKKPVEPLVGDEDNNNNPTLIPDGSGNEQKPEDKPVVDDLKDKNDEDVPQTGDNVVIYAVFAVVAIAGIAAVTIKMRKK